MEKRKADVIYDTEGHKIVLIHDLCFKGRKNVDWDTVEQYLKEYIGKRAEIIETSELVYIGADFPDEYAHSKDTHVLRGLNAYAKANAVSAIQDMIQIATDKTYSENHAEKHKNNAQNGWYRYNTRFALPKYGDDNELIGYNIFRGRLIVRYAKNGKLYLYDILRIKKETSRPL